MTPATLRARRIALGLTQGDVARLMDVEDRTVRRWEAGGAEPPGELHEQLVALLERRDEIARAWVVAGGPVVIPSDAGGIPAAIWWAAAGKAVEVLDCEVTAEGPALPVDGRSARATTLTAEQVEMARGLRDEGATLREIGAELGVDESTVRRVLGPGGRTGPRRRVDPDEVERLWRQGLSQGEIARQVGSSTMPVRRVLAERGLINWPGGVRRPKWLDGREAAGAKP